MKKLLCFFENGQQDASLVNGEKKAGRYYVDFIAYNLSLKNYFYRLTSDDDVFTNKTVLLKL